ncbi:aminoacyl-tRNA hydrolase [Fragilaria crotonensis]|nr:aminoacyl-tRNA hydrolase [Fragilaria crotonensis]
MATSSSPSTSSSISQPWIYFLSGALLPTLSYFLLFRPKKRNDDDNSDDDDHDDSEDDSDDDDLFGIETSGPSSKWSIMDAPYKEKSLHKLVTLPWGVTSVRPSNVPRGVAAWERTGCAKIAVKCPTQVEMETIAVTALERDIPLYLVEDAGRTQIKAGSRTVLGLGPAPVHVFEGLTSHLKLM